MLALLSLIAASTPAGPVDGRLVESTTAAPIAGAEIAVAGQRGTVRTDAAGRFQWALAPPLPAVIVVVLPDGRAARPIRLRTVDPSKPLILMVDAGLGELVVVPGVAPGIDQSPAAATTLLTARELALRQAPTLSQAIDGIPGVSAISEGQGAVPAIRGLARGRTLVLVDGNRTISERRAGANASFLDPGVLHSIEVARGPGSVAYGSDAFGGVIAARTRRPAYDQALRLRLSGTLAGGMPGQRGDFEVSKGHGTGGLLLAVRAREFDEYRSPAGPIPNSGWKDRGLRARWEQQGAGGVWSVGWQSDVARDIGRPRSDSATVLTTSPVEDSHRLTASFERGAWLGFRNVRFDALAGSSRQLTELSRQAAPARPRFVEGSEVSSREVQARLTGERVVSGARLHVGAEVQGLLGVGAIDSARAHTAAGVVASRTETVSIDSARRMDLGLFAEADAQVASRLGLSGGLRLDAVRSRNTGGFFGDRSTSHAALSGLLAATWTPAARLSLTGQAARGFRDPILLDRFYRGPVGRGFVEGNPDLRPETSLQFDLTARYAAGPVHVVVAAYHYRITDLVERYASTPSLFLVRNRGRAELQGVEAEVLATLPAGFGLALAAEVSRGRDGADRSPIDDVAAPAVSATVRRSWGARGATYVRLRAVSPHDAAGPSEVPTRGYTLVDGGLSWRLTPLLQLVASGRNLLNQAYQSSAGPRWVWAPGRHGSVTLVVTFTRAAPTAPLNRAHTRFDQRPDGNPSGSRR